MNYIETMEELEDAVNEGINNPDVVEMTLYIQMYILPEPEKITNPKVNLKAKLDYYKSAYNDELELNTFSKIKIIAYEYGYKN